MSTLNDPQIWTIIGVFAAALFGMLTFMGYSFMRALAGHVAQITSKIEIVETKLEARFERLEARVDNLDRDVQAIAKRVLGE